MLNFYGSSIREAHFIAEPKRLVMNFYHQQRLQQRKLHLELIIMDKVQLAFLMHHCNALLGVLFDVHDIAEGTDAMVFYD